MNLVSMFADSQILKDLQESVTGDTQLQEIILKSQMAVNSFIAEIGKVLVTDIIADTFMMYSQVFSTETTHYLTVAATLHNRQDGTQQHFLFPFRFQLVEARVGNLLIAPAGLHFDDPRN